MTTRSHTQSEQPNLLPLDCAALLQSEIEFWHEVIATCPVTQSVESLERMRQALALAEARLVRISDVSTTTVFPTWQNQ